MRKRFLIKLERKKIIIKEIRDILKNMNCFGNIFVYKYEIINDKIVF